MIQWEDNRGQYREMVKSLPAEEPAGWLELWQEKQRIPFPVIAVYQSSVEEEIHHIPQPFQFLSQEELIRNWAVVILF